MLQMVFANRRKLLILQLQDMLKMNVEFLKSQESPDLQSKILGVEFQSCILKKERQLLLVRKAQQKILESFLTLQALFLKCPNHQTHLLHCQIHEWKKKTKEISRIVWNGGFLKRKEQMLAWQGGRSFNNSIPLKVVGKQKSVNAFFSFITAVLLAQLLQDFQDFKK